MICASAGACVNNAGGEFSMCCAVINGRST